MVVVPTVAHELLGRALQVVADALQQLVDRGEGELRGGPQAGQLGEQLAAEGGVLLVKVISPKPLMYMYIVSPHLCLHIYIAYIYRHTKKIMAEMCIWALNRHRGMRCVRCWRDLLVSSMRYALVGFITSQTTV